jgi:hypothetical protein
MSLGVDWSLEPNESGEMAVRIRADDSCSASNTAGRPGDLELRRRNIFTRFQSSLQGGILTGLAFLKRV